MELRRPLDGRGGLIVGHALAALGRWREAHLAYSRAIERNPDDSEAFAGRAEAADHLGLAGEAASDRARSTYLRTLATSGR
jgi:cytochrome c-type biogenesis protein CcmH/NrfG